MLKLFKAEKQVVITGILRSEEAISNALENPKMFENVGDVIQVTPEKIFNIPWTQIKKVLVYKAKAEKAMPDMMTKLTLEKKREKSGGNKKVKERKFLSQKIKDKEYLEQLAEMMEGWNGDESIKVAVMGDTMFFNDMNTNTSIGA